MQNGWVKLHRELMDKPIWEASTAVQKVILITLLTMANHKEKEWEFNGKKYKAEPGQFVTSLESIRKKSGKDVSIKNVRTALLRFEKYDFLASQSTNRNRLITIVNWEFYQQKDDEVASEPASNRQATGKQPATNKNVRTKELKDLKDIRPKSATTEEDFESAHLLFNLIKQNFPNSKKPNFEKWANEFRLLRDVDFALRKDVKYIIQWSQQSSFWKSNIRSAEKFRKQYPTLYIQAEEAFKKQNVVAINSRKPDFEALKERLRNEEN